MKFLVNKNIFKVIRKVWGMANSTKICWGTPVILSCTLNNFILHHHPISKLNDVVIFVVDACALSWKVWVWIKNQLQTLKKNIRIFAPGNKCAVSLIKLEKKITIASKWQNFSLNLDFVILSLKAMVFSIYSLTKNNVNLFTMRF